MPGRQKGSHGPISRFPRQVSRVVSIEADRFELWQIDQDTKRLLGRSPLDGSGAKIWMCDVY